MMRRIIAWTMAVSMLLMPPLTTKTSKEALIAYTDQRMVLDEDLKPLLEEFITEGSRPIQLRVLSQQEMEKIEEIALLPLKLLVLGSTKKVFTFWGAKWGAFGSVVSGYLPPLILWELQSERWSWTALIGSVVAGAVVGMFFKSVVVILIGALVGIAISRWVKHWRLPGVYL